jgi:tRNA1Val (adenine37-N6)-methyltransferase
MNAFQFRQFIIQQEECAFKVGTDSILLGAWAEPPTQGHILDIGTGSGILALMMAQKTAAQMSAITSTSTSNSASTHGPNHSPPPILPAQITAIDRDEGSVCQAIGNAKNSPWGNRIEILLQSLQDFASQRENQFDFIISNPPYFNTQTWSTDPKVAQARNTIHLKFEELSAGVTHLLKKNGTFSLILPTAEAIEFSKIAGQSGLTLRKRCRVFPTIESTSEKRHLMLFEKTGNSPIAPLKPVEESTMAIETDQRHHYTEEFKNLTREFYLEFKN